MISIDDITPELLSKLTDEEHERVLRLIAEIGVPVWTPFASTPQELAYNSEADIIGYGGAAGGGKTDLICGLSITKHKRVLVIRREKAQTEGIVQRLLELSGGETSGYNSQKSVWRYKKGSSPLIEFGGLDNPMDHHRWQGRPHDLKALDEVTEMRESQARFVMGWNRTDDPSVKSQVLMTFNPPTNVEGRWVINFFRPWLDKKHPSPALPGELRYFSTVGDNPDYELDRGDRFVIGDGGEIIYDFDPSEYSEEQIITPKSRTFFPARVTDNPVYMASGYINTLQSLPEPLRSQMLYGDFEAGVEDDAWQVIPTRWVEIAMARWSAKEVKPDMDSLGVDVAMGGRDRTVISRRHGKWYDDLVVIKGVDCEDGAQVAGLVMARKRNNAPIHLDLFGVGAQVYGPLLSLGQQTTGVNVGDPSEGTDMTSKFKFFNLRSELIWLMREELDPAANNGIALPKDPELLQELCAFTWEPSGNKIKVHGTDVVKDKIGRSPDKAVAVVLARIETVKTADLRKFKEISDYDPLDAVESIGY